MVILKNSELEEIKEIITKKIDVNQVEVWQYTFTVEKYNENGEEIVYTADETEVNSSDLQFYTKEIQGTTIINTFTKNIDKTDITVTKKWVDNEEQAVNRPESIIIQVKNGTEIIASQEISEENKVEEEKEGNKVVEDSTNKDTITEENDEKEENTEGGKE